jgi:WD40 repeat protein
VMQAHLQMADTPHNSVISLLKDAQSLLGEYYEPIRIAPGSLYHSALLFMPRCDLYMATHEDAQDIRLLSPRKSAWTSDILIFQREYSGDTRPIVVSPDDTLIAAVEGHAGALVRVWKTSTGRVLNTWSDLSFNGDFINLSRILAITFSLDGRELAIITLYTVHWWDPYTDVQRTQPMDLQLPSRLRERTDGNCVTARIPSQSVISEGGACVVVGFSDPVDLGSLQTVDLNTSKALVLLHDVAVLSVAISHDASRIASSLDDGRMRIWNAHNGDLLSAMDGSFDSPTVALAFTYRHSIVSMTVDGAVFLLDASGSDTPLRLRTPPVQLQAPEQFCASVLLDSYNASAISASVRSPLLAVATTESVSIWSEETRMLVARRRLYTSLGGGCALGSAVAFMSSRIELVVAPTQEPMSLWDFQDRQAANHGPPFDLLGGAVNSVSFSHDGCYVISGSDDPDLRIWETTSGALKASVQTGHTHPVTAAAFALPDRSLVLSGSDDGQVMHMELCEAESGRLLKHLDSSPHWQTSNQLIAFSGDGSQFVTITRYMSMSPTVLRLYQFSTGKVLAEEREIHHAKFTAISFLPDGSRIIAVCGSSLMSWSTEPPLRDPRTMTAGVAAHWQSQDALFSFACSPDSARIVSTSPCSVIHLWDARTDKKIRSATFALLGDEKSAPLYGWKLQHVLQYSPTTPGRFLSCSWAGVVRIWNDETLAIERTITATELALVTRDDISLSYSTITACYAPDGTKIAVAVEFDLNGECSNSRRLELRVHDVNAGHTVQMLAPIISYPAHEDPGVPNPPSVPLNMSLSFSRENIFFLRPGQPRVEVWSVLSKEHIGSLPSPLRTELTAFAMCSITGRLIVACNPKSIRHQVTETATVSSELVARSGLAEYDATVMCTSIMQDLFDANQTYLCVWDTLSLQLRSTLRIGHDGYQPPHHCIDQASRSISGKLSLQRDIVPAAAWIPRLQRPRFILSPDGWLMFILSPDSWLPRYYRVDDFGGEDHGIFFPLCNIPPNRRPPDGALLDSYHCPWGPVAAHGHIVAIGSLKGPVTIIDLTSLMLKIEKEGKLGAARV